MKDDPIAKALNITPLIADHGDVVEPVVAESPSQEYAKTQIKSAIQDGQTALGELLQIASSSQHPRAYEVVATLIKTISDSSTALASIDHKQQELRFKTGDSGSKTVNNNLFVGNASELLRILKNAKNT